MTETKILNDKKIAVSGYRVLELLKSLMNSPLSTQEMLEILEDKTDNVYRNANHGKSYANRTFDFS